MSLTRISTDREPQVIPASDGRLTISVRSAQTPQRAEACYPAERGNGAPSLQRRTDAPPTGLGPRTSLASDVGNVEREGR
jgi:hypothetical protein